MQVNQQAIITRLAVFERNIYLAWHKVFREPEHDRLLKVFWGTLVVKGEYQAALDFFMSSEFAQHCKDDFINGGSRNYMHINLTPLEEWLVKYVADKDFLSTRITQKRMKEANEGYRLLTRVCNTWTSELGEYIWYDYHKELLRRGAVQ